MLFCLQPLQQATLHAKTCRALVSLLKFLRCNLIFLAWATPLYQILVSKRNLLRWRYYSREAFLTALRDFLLLLLRRLWRRSCVRPRGTECTRSFVLLSDALQQERNRLLIFRLVATSVSNTQEIFKLSSNMQPLIFLVRLLEHRTKLTHSCP